MTYTRGGGGGSLNQYLLPPRRRLLPACLPTWWALRDLSLPVCTLASPTAAVSLFSRLLLNIAAYRLPAGATPKPALAMRPRWLSGAKWQQIKTPLLLTTRKGGGFIWIFTAMVKQIIMYLRIILMWFFYGKNLAQVSSYIVLNHKGGLLKLLKWSWFKLSDS